jgi:hypothetical protein
MMIYLERPAIPAPYKNREYTGYTSWYISKDLQFPHFGLKSSSSFFNSDWNKINLDHYMLCIRSRGLKSITWSWPRFFLSVAVHDFLSEKGLRIRRMSGILLFSVIKSCSMLYKWADDLSINKSLMNECEYIFMINKSILALFILTKNDITLFKEYDFVYYNDVFILIYQTLIYW